MECKNIIFDLDGTLWDSRRSIIENWNEVLARFELIEKPLELDDLTAFMGHLPKDILKELFPEISPKTIDQILIEIAENENKSLRKHGGVLYENIEETLRELALKHDLYIVSNCQDGYIESFLAYFGFEKLFKDFESHGRTGNSKMENIQSVMKRNSMHPDETVYIGDTHLDYTSATENGLDFVFCSYGFGEMEETEVKTINNPAELFVILKY